MANDIAPRLPPPLVISLEEGSRRRVADILEMGGSGSVLETKKEAWVTECGAELGEEGKGMVLEGDPRKYGQDPSWTLRSVWRG